MELAEEITNAFNIIGSLVCHQRPERTLRVGGQYLPVCTRCTGVYIGLLLGLVLLLLLRRKEAKGPPNLYLMLAMTLPLFMDSLGQAFGFWTSTNDLRLITGLLFGTALGPMLIYMLSISPLNGKIPLLKNIQPEIVILDEKNSWFDANALVLGIFLSVTLFFSIRSFVNNDFFLLYWMLSIPTVTEIILHFFVLPLLLLIVAIRLLHHKK